jgi:hypothetical protein
VLSQNKSQDRWRGVKVALSLLWLLIMIRGAVGAAVARSWILFAGLLVLVLSQIWFNVRMLSRSNAAADHADNED